MDGKIDLITLISLIIAIVAILKLRSMLGRRTGDEETRLERYRSEQQRQAGAGTAPATDKVVTLPRRGLDEAPGAAPTQLSTSEVKDRMRTFAGEDERVTQGLLEIFRYDSDFDPEHFIRGARQAYEMIVTAFAEGNRKILRDLLSRDVYEGFVSAIADRESRGEQVDQSFVGISKAEIVEAEVKDGKAGITVRFLSQLISATRDRAGAVTAGDPQRIKEVTDIWTFTRDISTPKARQNPNWKLVATQAPN
jgi:predicted lipid-binding transport protein (Tim44 family)